MIRFLRRRTPPPPAQATRDAPIPLTSATDGHTHLISAADLDQTLTEHGCTYRSLCGRTVLAASLTTPPGPRCRSCHYPPHTGHLQEDRPDHWPRAGIR